MSGPPTARPGPVAATKPPRFHMIAAPTSEAQVAEAVQIARSRDLRVAVRAGGHHMGA